MKKFIQTLRILLIKVIFPMNDLVECTRCHKVLVNEEYDNHRCVPKITGIVTEKCAYHFIYKDPDTGNSIITIMGFNGISYNFIEIPENKQYTKIPYVLDDQPTVNTTNGQPGSYQSLM